MSKILELAKRIASTGGLETKTTETISGTYDSAGQQRLLSHAYTIGANLTITNGELILSRLADNGTSMTVEFGSDVTLSGDGTLMLGDLGQGQQNFDASTLTGTLPSTVFPAGHVLQAQEIIFNNLNNLTSVTTGSNTGINASITPIMSGSKILVRVHLTYGVSLATGVGMIIKRTGPSSTDLQAGSSGTYNWGSAQYHTNSTYTSEVANMHGLFTDTAQDTTTSHTYTVWVASNNSSTIKINGRTGDSVWCGTSSIQLTEIAG